MPSKKFDSAHLSVVLTVRSVTLAIQLLWGAFVLMRLWGWFLMAVDLETLQIGFFGAMYFILLALAVVSTTLLFTSSSYKNDGLELASKSFFSAMFRGALLLLIGFIFSGFL